MLLNLSNHPHQTDWSAEQKAVARSQFGNIQDWAFPAVSPEVSSEQVALQARQCLSAILQRHGPAHQFQLLVAGEQSLLFYLLTYALELGIECYTATSTRNTHLHPDGRKTIHFKFIQFRKIQL